MTKNGIWTENILHMFAGTDGFSPEGGLVLDTKENLYGTTAYGGTGNCVLIGSKVGCGTVYVMVRPVKAEGAWTQKVLYNFQGGKDGQFPSGDLVFDKKGNLYGATYYGGGYGRCNPDFYRHWGTIFELIAPKEQGGQWTERIL
jgi:hypothetical protein